MAKTRKFSNVEITADRVVGALIDRLIGTESKLASIQKELKEHMEMIAEYQPKLKPDGHLEIRAMRIAELDEVTVIVKTASAPAINPSQEEGAQ